MMARERALLLRHASLALEEDALMSAADLRDRLWVDVALSADRELWQEQLDSMEALARLARVDARAAWTLLLDTPAKQVYVEDVVTSRAPMRFRLAVPPEVLANDVVCATLQDLLGWGSCYQRHHTSQFIAFWWDMEELSAEDCAVLCIQQGYVPPHVVTRTAVLTRLVALAEAQRAAASRACCGCFQWKWTRVALDSIHTVTVNEVYDFARTLLDRGVRVARLRISPQAAVVDGTAAARFWRRSLRANGIDALTLLSSMDFRAFQGICHALATMPIVNIRPSLTFVIDDGAMDLAVRWAWLAAAIRGGARVALHFSGLKLPQARVFARFVATHRNRPRATFLPSATDVDRFAVLRAGANVSVGTTPTASGISTGTVVRVAEATALRVVDSISRGFHVGVQ